MCTIRALTALSFSLMICSIAQAATLEGTPAIRGQQATFTATGFAPGSTVYLAHGNPNGPGNGPCAANGAVCLDIKSPTLITSKQADSAGVATFNVTVPLNVPQHAWLQAVTVNPGDKAAPYRVQIFDNDCTDDAYEPNNDANSASSPAFGVVQDPSLGYLTSCMDDDVYRYSLDKHDQLDIEVTFSTGEGWLEFDLIDAATGAVITVAQSGSGVLTTTHQAASDQDVLIKVRGTDDYGDTVGVFYMLETTKSTPIVDTDGDGVAAVDDCDDNDITLGAVADDADCDGVLGTEDCDDTDPTVVNSNVDDADCDNVPTADDCDDVDANIGSSVNDADCDGVPSAMDCDDNDPTQGDTLFDTDCDGIPNTLDTCDDTNPTASANDCDADGVLYADDCDDNDNGLGDSALDTDCDGVLTADDCDDSDPAIGVCPGAQLDLLISEVVDHATNFNARYIELYNPNVDPVDLIGWTVARYANGGTSPAVVTLQGTIPGFGTYLIANNTNEFEIEFGFAPDSSSGYISGSGDDVYALFDDGTLVDIYGVIGVDGSGEPWEYLDSVVQRDPLALATPVFDQNEWTITAGTADATPGDHNSGSTGNPGWSHSIAIDGDISDWYPEEIYSTTSGTGQAGYTWDDDNIYIMYQHPDLETGGSQHWLTIYLQTDATSSGATQGITIGSQTPEFTTVFSPTLFYAMKADGTYDMANSWNGQMWDTNGDWFFNNATVHRGSQTVEIMLPQASLASLNTVATANLMRLVMSMVYEGQGYESSYDGIPNALYADGYNPTYDGYLEFDLTGSSPSGVMLP